MGGTVGKSPDDERRGRKRDVIDKTWHDWQRWDLSNKITFGGGSISVQVDPGQASTHLTGVPPFFDVRDNPSS